MEYNEYKDMVNNCKTFDELQKAYETFQDLPEDVKDKVRITFGDGFANTYLAYKGMKERGTLEHYLMSRKVIYLFRTE